MKSNGAAHLTPAEEFRLWLEAMEARFAKKIQWITRRRRKRQVLTDEIYNRVTILMGWFRPVPRPDPDQPWRNWPSSRLFVLIRQKVDGRNYQKNVEVIVHLLGAWGQLCAVCRAHKQKFPEDVICAILLEAQNMIVRFAAELEQLR